MNVDIADLPWMLRRLELAERMIASADAALDEAGVAKADEEGGIRARIRALIRERDAARALLRRVVCAQPGDLDEAMKLLSDLRAAGVEVPP